MLTSQYLFRGNSEIDMLYKIFNFKGTPVAYKSNHTKGKKVSHNSSNGKKETTASSRKYDEELDQPKIKNFENYPHLIKYGAMFP